MVPAKGKATSITEDLAESKIPSASNLKISVSPKNTSLNKAITNAITKNAIQIIFKAINQLFVVLI